MESEDIDYKKLYEDTVRERKETEQAVKQRREEVERREQETERREQETERREQETERREQETERREQETERREQEIAKREQEAERREQEVERSQQNTTLPECLDACHVNLYLGLGIQKVMTAATQGSPANAENKPRPQKLIAWAEYPSLMERVWGALQDSPSFLDQRMFPNLLYFQVCGEDVRSRQMGSELDLHYFARATVENIVTRIMGELYKNTSLRQRFHLKGTVSFENHSNMLSPETSPEEHRQIATTEDLPRRSQRLSAKRQRGLPVPEGQITTSRQIRPDQICVYNKSSRPGMGTDLIVPALVIEYKPPHKVPLDCIMDGLEDMDLGEVVYARADEGLQEQRRRIIAAVVTQTYSYMIRAGLAYGYICTGEAYIFLHVPENDFGTVEYFLSVPGADVGVSTGWPAKGDGKNRLHLTAVGQVLAFTLRALATPVRPLVWRQRAEEAAPKWAIVLEELFNQAAKTTPPAEDSSLSDYQPPRRRGEREYLRASPVGTRALSAHRRSNRGCNPSMRQSKSVEDDSDHDGGGTCDPETSSSQASYPAPSSASWSGTGAAQIQSKRSKTGAASSSNECGVSQGSLASREFCTQECLRGLQHGGALDIHCPNVRDHGQDRHRINQRAFLRLLHRELVGAQPLCLELGAHGARGLLFKVMLGSHGYTMVAKGTTAPFVSRLQHEAAIYRRLYPLQGKHVPVCLGCVDIQKAPIRYWGLDRVVHLLVLGFAGRPVHRCADIDRKQLLVQAQLATTAIHNLGVLHGDLDSRNILWDAAASRLLIVDFDRAVIASTQQKFDKHAAAVGQIALNRKRKRRQSEAQEIAPEMQVKFRQDLSTLKRAFA